MIHNNLLKYRSDAGLTITELSVTSGVSIPVLHRIEKGTYAYKNGPNLLTLKRIYRGLKKELPDLSFNDLFPGQEDKIAS